MPRRKSGEWQTVYDPFRSICVFRVHLPLMCVRNFLLAGFLLADLRVRAGVAW